MIADPLATYISDRFVAPRSKVLDPFCGTARTLIAAAERGAYCVGLDVNPLAINIARAKAAHPSVDEMETVFARIPAKLKSEIVYDLEPNRTVKWFSRRAIAELSELIVFVNTLKTSQDTLAVVATILSATVREVSFCRKDQWKLHRMSGAARSHYRVSPFSVFRRRLRSFITERLGLQKLPGRCRMLRGDSRELVKVLRRHRQPDKYDLIVTSPPYGDSQTTVSYGGMSSICLGVLRHLAGLNLAYTCGGTLDRRCLGGGLPKPSGQLMGQLRRYWSVSEAMKKDRRVSSYLYDLQVCCSQIKRLSHKDTILIFVIARRNVLRRRVYTDRFLTDQLRSKGFLLQEVISRRIRKKNTPPVIDRNGAGRGTKRTATIRRELILVYKR